MIYKHQMDWFNYGKPVQAKSQFWSDYMRNIKGTVDAVAHLSPKLRQINKRAQSLEREPRLHDFDDEPRRTWETDVPVYSNLSLPRSLDDSYYNYPTTTAYSREPWYWNESSYRPIYYPSSYSGRYFYRPTYLSPIRKAYLWSGHPIRHYGHRYN